MSLAAITCGRLLVAISLLLKNVPLLNSEEKIQNVTTYLEFVNS
jgi:hypothetical protein